MWFSARQKHRGESDKYWQYLWPVLKLDVLKIHKNEKVFIEDHRLPNRVYAIYRYVGQEHPTSFRYPTPLNSQETPRGRSIYVFQKEDLGQLGASDAQDQLRLKQEDIEQPNATFTIKARFSLGPS